MKNLKKRTSKFRNGVTELHAFKHCNLTELRNNLNLLEML